jgi:hypothetical protein
MSDEAKEIWVYGIVPADASLETLQRLGGDELHEVWILEDGELAAIVSEPPAEDAKATRERVLAHAHVLEAAVRDAPVVPLRFGTVCPDENAVVNDLLEERREEFEQILDKVRDRVQMTLKAYYEEEPILRELLAEEPELRKLRETTRGGSEEATYNARVQLGEMINSAIEQRRNHDAKQIVDRLKPLTVAGVDEPLEHEMMVLNVPFLVERKRVDEFESAVDEIASDQGERMRFRLLGPLPAYHFVDAEEPAWA